jgi:hypothetical protein
MVMDRKWQFAIGIGSFGMFAVAALVHMALAATGTPITVTFREAFPLTGGDQIGSDNGTAYVNGGTVEAVFDASGDLHFYTDLHNQSGGRTLALDFQQPIPGCTNCNPPFMTPTLVDAFMSTSGVAVGGHTVAGLLGMPVPPAGSVTTGLANLNINFPGWFVRFNPGNYPGSTQVTVTRNDERNWTITVAAPQVAGLIKLSNGGKTQTNAGEFYMPTQITINCPTC